MILKRRIPFRVRRSLCGCDCVALPVEPQEPPHRDDLGSFRRLPQEGDQGVPRPDGRGRTASERGAFDPARPDGAQVPCGRAHSRLGLEDIRNRPFAGGRVPWGSDKAERKRSIMQNERFFKLRKGVAL